MPKIRHLEKVQFIHAVTPHPAITVYSISPMSQHLPASPRDGPCAEVRKYPST